ncbi:MAG TPA: hypothetical protein VJ372_21735, partial [Pyrinomonadaceae bacterium]|nr:hypothetical protein [Pyrinomonadaceae bacterium]
MVGALKYIHRPIAAGKLLNLVASEKYAVVRTGGIELGALNFLLCLASLNIGLPPDVRRGYAP